MRGQGRTDLGIGCLNLEVGSTDEANHRTDDSQRECDEAQDEVHHCPHITQGLDDLGAVCLGLRECGSPGVALVLECGLSHEVALAECSRDGSREHHNESGSTEHRTCDVRQNERDQRVVDVALDPQAEEEQVPVGTVDVQTVEPGHLVDESDLGCTAHDGHEESHLKQHDLLLFDEFVGHADALDVDLVEVTRLLVNLVSEALSAVLPEEQPRTFGI